MHPIITHTPYHEGDTQLYLDSTNRCIQKVECHIAHSCLLCVCVCVHVCVYVGVCVCGVRCGSKQGEDDYRPLFENFVQDLLMTVNKPEWPAAELLLSLLGRLLVRN